MGTICICDHQQHGIDHIMTTWLQSLLLPRFREYQAHYRDVHDRNVLFEIRAWDQPGVPMVIKTPARCWQLVRVGLQAIDVC